MTEIKLTKEQSAVVNDRGGTLLVSAAAGSGKTKVLIDRVLKRVTEENCDLDQFLMITYTSAAATELRGKLMKALSQRLSAQPEDRRLHRQMSRVYLAQISTVHSFCSSLLKEFAHELSIPADFRVCDEQEAQELRHKAMQSLLTQLYRQVDSDEEYAAALDMLGAGRNDAGLPQLIEKLHDTVQCDRSPEDRLNRYFDSLNTEDLVDVGQTPWGQFLLEEAGRSLRRAAERLHALAQEAEASKAVEKYAPFFRQCAQLVETAAGAASWQELHQAKLTFDRAPTIRNCADEELKKRLKSLYDLVKKDVGKICERFQLSSEHALEDIRASAPQLRGLLRLTGEFSRLFRQEKLRRHVLDYNDLEHDTLRLLCRKDGTPTRIAREISGRFLEIMVDEYQDTNEVQDAIFHAVSRQGQNLFFVGDVKQSIYGFRMAAPRLFREKYQLFADYTTAAPGEPRKILLSDNFRSQPEVLSAANDVFRLTMTERVGGLRYGDREALRPRQQPQPSASPAVELHCIDLEDMKKTLPVSETEIEARYIAQRIEEMLQHETIPENDGVRRIQPEDIVILIRSMAGRASIYMAELQRRGITCVCGNEDIFASEEVQFLSAFLQIIHNPHRDIPLLTVLLSPVIGMRTDEIAACRAKHPKGDLYEALGEHPFTELLRQLRQAAQTQSLRELLDELQERTMLRAIYGTMEGGIQRKRNIDTFLTLADQFESGRGCGLSDFLRYLEGLKSLKTDEASVKGAVRLMTIHKSKGLEFPVVFLAGLSKGFNTTDARARVLLDARLGIGSSVYDSSRGIAYSTVARTAIAERMRQESVSEELRVLYVAMTRPKYRLVMTFCQQRLEKYLGGMVEELSDPAEAAENARCMGDWVLMTALTHTEAGALFARCGYPQQRGVSEYPWRIEYHCASELEEPTPPPQTEETEQTAYLLPEPPTDYVGGKAVQTPSKLTATQLKGRRLDEELEAVQRKQLPTPRFELGHRGLSPTERGTAIHLAMQFIDYGKCTDLPGVERELKRLEEGQFLSRQQVEAVNPRKILNFFRSELGQRILSAEQVVREFKFSLLEDAGIYDPELAGEKILLQGVTDCCILEPDGIVIVDFKSDRIKPGEEAERGNYYAGQLEAYARAIAQIFSLPAKEKLLYFFATDRAVEIP